MNGSFETPRRAATAPLVIAVVGILISIAQAITGVGTANASSATVVPPQKGACVATNTRFDFAVYLTEVTGGVHPSVGRVHSSPASQFRWVVHEYRRETDGSLTLLRSWLQDPPGVASEDTLQMASAGFTVPANQITFKVGAVKAKADGSIAGWCSTFTK